MNPTSQSAIEHASSRGSEAAAVLRVTSGNFLEQFDFFLFGFYAAALTKIFFPWRMSLPR